MKQQHEQVEVTLELLLGVGEAVSGEWTNKNRCAQRLSATHPTHLCPRQRPRRFN